MMVQECRNKTDLILRDKEVDEKLLQTIVTVFILHILGCKKYYINHTEHLWFTAATLVKGGWHRERSLPTVPITFLFLQCRKITSPIQIYPSTPCSKTNQIIRTFSSGQLHLSQESPPGFCNISSTTAPIRTGLGFTRAGVFVNLITQRRSRLGLLRRNANAGVRLHFILESVLKMHICLSLYK